MKLITSDFLYIFHVINYFFRFSMTYVCKTANVSNVISSLKNVFVKYVTFKAIYCDREQHFNNMKIREFLRREDIIIIYNSFDSFKSIDMIKVSNRLLEDIMRRSSEKWDIALFRSVRLLNSRIVTHLKAFSSKILIDTFSSFMFSIIDSKILSATSNVMKTWFN